MPVICLAGIVFNIALTRYCINYAGIPLYLDTVFTITVTLSCGLVWGMVCGALTNILCHTIFGWGWEPYLFTICNIATAVITWYFHRTFYSELAEGSSKYMQQKSSRLRMAVDRVILLVIFSFILCVAMSILGGLIATLILKINSSYVEGYGISSVLSNTLFGQEVSVLFREIVSRIPINIIDRLLSVFAGYGFALLLFRWVKVRVIF